MSRFENCEAGRYAYAVIDLVSRKWIASIVGPEATSSQVRVLFLKALEAEGLLTDDIQASPPSMRPSPTATPTRCRCCWQCRITAPR